MQLFYTPNIQPPHHTLSEDESRHCVRVLRLGRGGEIHLTDGRGNLYRATIVDTNPKACTVRVEDVISDFGKRDYSLTVAIAPTKNADRYEWFLEKATEIGVDRIIPVECDHSERRTIKHDRSMRVITGAVKQSLKAYHPALDEMTPLKEVIGMPFDGVKLIAHCREGEIKPFIDSVLPLSGNALVLIGPEGDFSEQEIEAALASGFVPVSLGPSRLRTETAGIAAVMAAYVKNNSSDEAADNKI